MRVVLIKNNFFRAIDKILPWWIWNILATMNRNFLNCVLNMYFLKGSSLLHFNCSFRNIISGIHHGRVFINGKKNVLFNWSYSIGNADTFCLNIIFLLPLIICNFYWFWYSQIEKLMQRNLVLKVSFLLLSSQKLFLTLFYYIWVPYNTIWNQEVVSV